MERVAMLAIRCTTTSYPLSLRRWAVYPAMESSKSMREGFFPVTEIHVRIAETRSPRTADAQAGVEVAAGRVGLLVFSFGRFSGRWPF
jgi:hypothetical protein